MSNEPISVKIDVKHYFGENTKVQELELDPTTMNL